MLKAVESHGYAAVNCVLCIDGIYAEPFAGLDRDSAAIIEVMDTAAWGDPVFMVQACITVTGIPIQGSSVGISFVGLGIACERHDSQPRSYRYLVTGIDAASLGVGPENVDNPIVVFVLGIGVQKINIEPAGKNTRSDAEMGISGRISGLTEIQSNFKTVKIRFKIEKLGVCSERGKSQHGCNY